MQVHRYARLIYVAITVYTEMYICTSNVNLRHVNIDVHVGRICLGVG